MTMSRFSHEHDAFERELLASAELDEPSTDCFVRVAAAVGVAVGVSLTSAAAAASTTSVVAAGASTSVGAVAGGTSMIATGAAAGAGTSAIAGGGAATATSIGVIKWVIFGAVGGLAASGGAHYASQKFDSPAAVVQPAETGNSRGPKSSAPNKKVRLGKTVFDPELTTAEPAREAPASDTPRVGDLPAAPAVIQNSGAQRKTGKPAARTSSAAVVQELIASAKAATPQIPTNSAVASFQALNLDEKKAAAQAPAVPDSSLSEQVAWVDSARKALARGDARNAAQLLAQYQQRWPGGVLATEAAVLRIEALEKLGRHEMARSLAKKFIAAQPNSRHSERLRVLFSLHE